MSSGRSRFFPESAFGRLGDQDSIEQYVSSLASMVSMEFDASYRILGDARNLMLTIPQNEFSDQEAIETSIQEALYPLTSNGLGSTLIPKNGIIAFAGTLPDARSIVGWGICDGQGGRPDLRHKFLRGAGADDDSGGTGGQDVTSVGIDSHSDDFAVSVTEGAPNSTLCVVPCASGCPVASSVHTHQNLTGSLTGSIDDHTVTQSDNKPPYYEVIWLIKL